MKTTLFAVLFLSLIASFTATAQASENILITPMNQVSQSELTPLALPAVMGKHHMILDTLG